ncbi:MAG TPA: retropepsin-like aspartic protease [Nonomuraea sp.]|nr:retropepsin-like aspartic protease [Nonomuraea sp.]
MRKLLVLIVVALLAAGCTLLGAQPPPSGDEKSIRLRVVETRGTALALAPVHIKGEGPYQFLLDTGASISTIDEQLARELNLEFTGDSADVRGIGGRTNVELIRVDRWRVGDVNLDAVRMAALDLGDDRRGVVGLLGADVLHDFGRVTVDYDRERLLLPDDPGR